MIERRNIHLAEFNLADAGKKAGVFLRGRLHCRRPFAWSVRSAGGSARRAIDRERLLSAFRESLSIR